MTSVRAAVYRGKKNSRRNARGDKQTTKAANARSRGNTARAEKLEKKASRSYKRAEKAGAKNDAKKGSVLRGARPTPKPPRRPAQPGSRPVRGYPKPVGRSTPVKKGDVKKAGRRLKRAVRKSNKK